MNNKLRSQGSSVKNWPSSAALDASTREALRSLDDPIALEGLVLSRLRSVQVLAATKYRGRTCGTGLALRHLLRQALDELADEMEGTQIGALAAGLRSGTTQAAVARELGVSEEHLCRRWKPVLVQLIHDALVAGTGDLHEAA